MKLPSFAGLAAVALSLFGLVAGQQEMPACASQCLVSSLKAQTVCTPTNTTCICTDPALNAAIQGCITQACTIKETLTALNVTATMCQRPVRDRTYITTVVSSVTGGSALILVIIRTLNAFAAGTFGYDDACAAAAGVFMIAMNAVQFPIGKAGFGKDIWTVPFDNLYFIQKMVYLTQVFYWPVSAFTKMAFLFFYLRIFPRRELRKYIFGSMGLTLVYWAVFQFGNTFYCHPVSYVWTSWDHEHQGKCLNINTFMFVAAGINLCLDLAILIIPIPELLKLQLALKKKIAILCMFSVGSFTLVVSILRLEQLVSYAKTTNPTWDNVPADYWSVMEANVGVFCVCMPALRYVLGRYLPGCFSTMKGSSKYNKYDDTPNARVSSNKFSGRKTPKSTLSGSLFDKTITKTIDTTVQRLSSDDEVQLVDMQKSGKNFAASTGSNDDSLRNAKGMNTFYHQ